MSIKSNTSLYLALILLATLLPSDLFSQDSNRVEIVGVGDIMMGTNFPKGHLPPGNDCMPLIEAMAEHLRGADYSFGNLECAVSNNAELEKRCKDTTKCYAFRMPEKYMECLSSVGFDAMSLANNHSGDFGLDGRNKTKELLEANSIGYAGLLSDPTDIREVNGLKIGLAAFAPNSGTCDIRQIARAQAIVSDLAGECDIVVVSFHGGAEGKENQHVTRETEEFYGENRGNVYKFSHAMIDAGADVVFGHGPHVVRAVELYNDRFIAYSLGNFCTYSRFNVSGPNGLAPLVKVFTDRQGKFIEAEVVSGIQRGEGGLKIDPNSAAFLKMAELTASDFPETSLQFSGGKIVRKGE
jgi:hypothetical protein